MDLAFNYRSCVGVNMAFALRLLWMDGWMDLNTIPHSLPTTYPLSHPQLALILTLTPTCTHLN